MNITLGRVFMLAAILMFVVALVLHFVGGYRDAVTVFALGGFASFAAGHL